MDGSMGIGRLMTTKIRRGIHAMMIGSALFGAARLGAQEAGIPVGSAAPVMMLEDVDGKPVDLGTWIGKRPVVLEFWATWCSNCEELEPTIKAAHARYGDRVAFVGIAVPMNQSARRVKLYAAKHGIPLALLYDRTGAAIDAYQVPATSYVVVVNAAGTVVYTGLGGEQDLAAAIEKGLR
jgi:thiol-disulfide isomerase/thioredoxin